MIYDHIPINKVILQDVRQGLKALPDNCIHMVVTSPPYYKMRKYQSDIDTVWGGDDKCEHRWGDAMVGSDNLRFRAGKSSQVGNDINPKIRVGKAGEGGSLCVRCGAWRGQLGQEPTVDMYIRNLTGIMGEIRRVLRPDGVVFFNIGDCWFGSGTPGGDFRDG